MATPEEQITPADAAIVTTGTGRKGPEEHDLPESLKYDMDLCLEILRNVLGEYNPELLSTFDTVRHYAVEASAEHFAELKDPNPDQDGLKEAVNVIDNMTLHDAQLLARAFATYFHLANLSEENYRVSVLHERENNVPVDQAVDPINELTVAYHQLINETGPAKAKELLNQLEFHPVFTAHPTEARRKAVEGKIRRVSELLEEYKRLGGSDKKECLRRLYNEIDALSLDSYCTTNLNLGYTLRTKAARSVRFGLMVYNLFDSEYCGNGYGYSYMDDGKRTDVALYFPQAPLNVLANVTVKF